MKNGVLFFCLLIVSTSIFAASGGDAYNYGRLKSRNKFALRHSAYKAPAGSVIETIQDYLTKVSGVWIQEVPESRRSLEEIL